LAKAVTLAVAVGGAAVAQAYEAGDFIVRVGAATVQPNDDSSALNLVGTGGLPASGASVENSTRIGLNAVYMVSDNIGVELLAANPFKHGLKAHLGDAFGGATVSAGSTKHLPPTLSAQYYFGNSESTIRPYVGVGLNYTVFFSEKVSPQLYGGLGASSAQLSLDDSWGLAFRAGVDYRLGNNWSVGAGMWWIDIDTEAEFKFSNGAVVTTDVEIDPMVYMLSVGYTF
jgi:outer membrane protein